MLQPVTNPLQPRIEIGSHVHGVGDINAAVGQQIVAVAFGHWNVYDITKGGPPIVCATQTEAEFAMADIARRVAANG